MRSAPPFRYSVYGVSLLSELALALPYEVHGCPSNVVVELIMADNNSFRGVTEHLSLDPKDWFHHVVLENGALYMRWEDLFDFIVAPDGQRVLCRKLANAAIESFEAYLTNFAVSAALLQQGEEPLHATVIEAGDSAVGLMGPSGAGKSTLAAFMIGQGGDLITDDMLRIRFINNAAIAYPGPYRLKLFKEAAERFLTSGIERGRFNPIAGKFIFEPSTQTEVKVPRRLSALYFLDSRTEQESSVGISIKRLAGVELFMTIAASTINSRLSIPRRLERQFRFAEHLARIVPIYKLSYPRNFELLGQVADLIYQTARQ